jgi:hypothetical protein
MKVGDIVRLTGHKYIAIVMEAEDCPEELEGGDPWAIVKWINHPRLSGWWYQYELEKVNG